MKFKTLVFLSLLLLIADTGFAQTVKVEKLPSTKKILKKYVKAIGGRKAVRKVTTRVSTGTVEIPAAGLKGAIEVFGAAPDKTYSNTTLNGVGQLVESYDGKIGWSTNPIQGSRDKAGQELLQAKLLAGFHREIELEKLYPKMEVRGLEKIGDTEVYAVTATPEGLPSETWYFDKTSGLLLRADMTLATPEGNTTVKAFFEDYRVVDGIKTPFKLRTVLPQFELITLFTEIKNNVPIDDAKFAKPKQ